MRIFDAEQREIVCTLLYGPPALGTSDAPDGRDDDDGELLSALLRTADVASLSMASEADVRKLLPALTGEAAAEYYGAWQHDFGFCHGMRVLHVHCPVAHAAIQMAIADFEVAEERCARAVRPR